MITEMRTPAVPAAVVPGDMVPLRLTRVRRQPEEKRVSKLSPWTMPEARSKLVPVVEIVGKADAAESWYKWEGLLTFSLFARRLTLRERDLTAGDLVICRGAGK